jgi:hypothetical protein
MESKILKFLSMCALLLIRYLTFSNLVLAKKKKTLNS